MRTPLLSLPSVPPPTMPTSLTKQTDVDVLIIGAGPTGLGAAKRMNQIVRSNDEAFVEPELTTSRTVRHG